VKSWLRLRDRRERERTGLTLVDGLREIDRALAANALIEEVVVGPAAETSAEGRALSERLAGVGIRLVRVSAAVVERLAFGDRAEGLVAVVRVPSLALDDLDLPAEPLVAVLEGLEKPGNLGAILRSADGAGADAVLVADPRTDPFNPNAIRASAGTIFSMPMAIGSSVSIHDWCRERGLRVVAARVDGAVAHTDADLRGGCAVVLGNEADGLGAVWRGPEVVTVRLPMLGRADSLNVSVAGAVLLYEARRQRDLAARSRRARGAPG
jgi:TrmH family RNA methyltransferase